ncbi:hypothetical protein [Floridanema aerugineum]|jgi:hypothetical protein|uniref:Uncharacterized protein n=1 Tax=Floridaenema aerugineum BLCC-F46 TaxID=3153654 RepID=A0ABV4XFT7_9CYAN
MELSISTNQTLEYLECVLRFESSFMSDDISSEDYEYFFEVAREQGLDISEAYARFAKLQTQVRTNQTNTGGFLCAIVIQTTLLVYFLSAFEVPNAHATF